MTEYPLGLSVVITTWNRADSLNRTLEEFTTIRTPETPWELIVVDNDSTDRTRHVIANFGDRLPIVYYSETQPGQCEARNAGIRLSRYELIVFTDDDITPSRDWLVAYANAMLTQPDAAYFGGPICLDLRGCEIPPWAQAWCGDLQSWVAKSLAKHDLGAVDPSGWTFFGGNMAYRRLVFERFGLFDPRVGHTRGRRFGAEEVLLQIKLRKSGYKPSYISDALVWHRIRQDELTFASRFKRAFWSSQGKARALYLAGEDVRIDVRRTLRHGRDFAFKAPNLLLGTASRRYETLCELAAICGYEMQMLVLLWDSDCADD